MNGLEIDVFDMLERIGIHGHSASGGAECNYSCPFHQDERPSAYMNLETSAWFCWSCKAKGKNAVSFVARVHGVSWATADSWLTEAYGVNFSEPRGGSMLAEFEAMFDTEATLKPLPPSPSWITTFAVDYKVPNEQIKYLLARGLNIETLEEWGVSYDHLSDRPVFPIHDHEGTVVGWKGRAWHGGQDPRYLVLGDRGKVRYGFVPVEGSGLVFGLHRAPAGELVICEGELNAMALWQEGVAGPVAIGMSYFSDLHARLILTKANRVVVFTDTDAAGNVALADMVRKLEDFIPVRVVAPHEGDPMDMIGTGRALELIAAAKSTMAVALQ